MDRNVHLQGHKLLKRDRGIGVFIPENSMVMKFDAWHLYLWTDIIRTEKVMSENV